MKRELITVKQLCDYLGVSRSYITRLTQKNDLPCIRIGGRVFFDQAEVDKWLDDHHSEVES